MTKLAERADSHAGEEGHDSERDRVFRKFQGLNRDTKSKFVVPDIPISDVEIPEAEQEEVIPIVDEDSFQAEQDRIVERDAATIRLLNKAVVHVNKFDSKETAAQLMFKAYQACPSVFNKRKISFASQSLKAAIKAEKWMLSRRRKKHVDKDTVKKNITTFHEKVSEAVLSIQIEIEKRTSKLFKRIKDQYASELPLSLPKTKKSTTKKAHVTVHCVNAPTTKAMHLEGMLYLVENARVIGVNHRQVKDSLKKAKAIAYKLGATVYETRLSRPSDNIHWYLISDFGTKITYASFADSMHLSDEASGGSLSYADYVKGQEANKRIDQKLKTQRLAALRKKFAEDNTVVTDDIRTLRGRLASLEQERTKIKETFVALTSISDTDKGLNPTFINSLDKKMLQYRDQLMFSERMTFGQANLAMIHQRIEARTQWFELKQITEEIRELKRQIQFFEQELERRKARYADSLGMINLAKHISDNLD